MPPATKLTRLISYKIPLSFLSGVLGSLELSYSVPLGRNLRVRGNGQAKLSNKQSQGQRTKLVYPTGLSSKFDVTLTLKGSQPSHQATARHNDNARAQAPVPHERSGNTAVKHGTPLCYIKHNIKLIATPMPARQPPPPQPGTANRPPRQRSRSPRFAAGTSTRMPAHERHGRMIQPR